MGSRGLVSSVVAGLIRRIGTGIAQHGTPASRLGVDWLHRQAREASPDEASQYSEEGSSGKSGGPDGDETHSHMYIRQSAAGIRRTPPTS